MSEPDSLSGSSRVCERLLERLRKLRKVYGDGLISMEMLGSQLMEFVESPDAGRFRREFIKPDALARRLLIRLEDPARWRLESGKPEEERLLILRRRLADILLDAGEPDRATLELILDTADLPHFASFIDTGEPDAPLERAGVELSVLD